MGLDSVELVMEVEKAFSVSIPDREAERMVTVKDLYDTVWRYVQHTSSQRCYSQVLFYRLRKGFADSFNMPPASFRPDIQPEQLFPNRNRRKIYDQFAASLDMKLPALELPKFWNELLIWVALLTTVGSLAVAILLISAFNGSYWNLLLPVEGVCVTILLSELLDPKRLAIPAPTVRIFVQQMIGKNFDKLIAGLGVNRADMEAVIRQIIVDKIGVEWDEVNPDATFTDDLGVD